MITALKKVSHFHQHALKPLTVLLFSKNSNRLLSTHLFLSVICSCIILSLAGGIYAPPVRVRIGSTSSFFFFEVVSSWASELWTVDLSGLLRSGDEYLLCFLRSDSLSSHFSWCLSLPLSILLKKKKKNHQTPKGSWKVFTFYSLKWVFCYWLRKGLIPSFWSSVVIVFPSWIFLIISAVIRVSSLSGRRRPVTLYIPIHNPRHKILSNRLRKAMLLISTCNTMLQYRTVPLLQPEFRYTHHSNRRCSFYNNLLSAKNNQKIKAAL